MLPRYRAPILMATQHPDSARMITTSQEVEEAIEAISLFRCDEIMVDYEGKLTPYHQPEWIVDKAHEKGLRAGIDFLISPRIPNDVLEGVSRHIHSIVTALITNWKAQRMGLEQPVRYIIIPMVESTNHFQAVVRRVSRLQQAIHEELGLEEGYIDIVPLLESVDSQLEIHRYVETISRQDGRNPWTHRIFLGKSDSALLSGHIASSLALRIALSKLYRASEERDLEISPIIGMGKPPSEGTWRSII
jgi:phosphoenolpyruvate carboxylase